MIKKDDPLINVDSLREQIIKNSVRIIDVRRTDDYQQGHITNSVNLPLAKLLADSSPENIVKIYGTTSYNGWYKIINVPTRVGN